MKEPFYFHQHEADAIQNRFGTDFYDKVKRDIEEYTAKWKLSSIRFIPSYSANLVFRCHSEAFGDAVLKLGNLAYPEIKTEIHALCQYGGGRYCQVFADDRENGVILEEWIQPGTPLRDENSLEQRLTVFCSLYKGLHINPTHADCFPTYTEWVGRITDYMSTRQDCPELYHHMRQANEICGSVAGSYSRQMLLHGDLHHDNILLGKEGEYRIIDPKGVVGDPIFDVARFILNEFGDEITEDLHEKILGIITFLAKELVIPPDILKKCLYVETAMGMCWSVEDVTPSEEYRKLLSWADFAETVMKA
ncbi:aminoglycoside phosphotransferase family protein [Gorillibacterium timonense]|uniref:aminoglycoside phosphotransferase family protein n=1 Tax=Gorillibacterium timonense TaxID=1689269 RepID=UPI00071C78EC|nr:aminoglycoside phosphotransferase family protein [Gorillibacterium timonense]